MYDGGKWECREVLRRKFLVGVAGFVVTGCVGEGAEGGDGWENEREPPRTENLGSVPDVYETTEDVTGREREPGRLMSFGEVNYQSKPVGDQRCDRCRYWIPDKNGDGLGACSVVANKIEPDGWCSRYTPRE